MTGLPEVSTAEIRALFDRQQIDDQIVRFCRAIDRRDVELLKSVNWPDAVDRHRVYEGSAMESADMIIPWLREVSRPPCT